MMLIGVQNYYLIYFFESLDMFMSNHVKEKYVLELYDRWEKCGWDWYFVNILIPIKATGI